VSDHTRLLPFVQLEFTHAIGPAAGRYVVAGDGAPAPGLEGADVLLLDVEPAPAVKRRRLRGAQAGSDAGPVALAIATHVKASLAGDGDGDEAVRWVTACQEDPALQGAWVDEALRIVNRAIRAHRATCGDPYFTELTATDPRAARIGFGAASEVSAGRWRHAFAVVPLKSPKLGHAERSVPSEVVAAALAGHPVSLQADELILRALLDLDQGRTGLAALQLHAAARMLAAEVGDEHGRPLPELRARLDELTRDVPPADGPVAADELHAAAATLRMVADHRRAEVLAGFRRGA
jgi:hypothetical protein